jgi:membrane protease YdiL (CAAX protease family)
MAAALAGLLKKRGYSPKETLKIYPIPAHGPRLILMTAFSLFLLESGLAFILDATMPMPPFFEDLAKFDRPASIWGWVVLYIGGCLTAPILEEFAFRGLLQSSLYQNYGLFSAIVIPSLLFGLLHVVPHGVVIIFIGSIIYGYIVFITGSVFSSIIMHSFSNFMVFTSVALFPDAELITWTDGLIALIAVIIGALLVWHYVKKIRSQFQGNLINHGL